MNPTLRHATEIVAWTAPLEMGWVRIEADELPARSLFCEYHCSAASC